MKIGQAVVYRTQNQSLKFNGSKDHPAIITRIWSQDCVNLKVIPDCGAIRDETSAVRIDPTEEGLQGWFTE